METIPPDYASSLEWPGTDVDSDFEAYPRSPTSQHQTCFRLVVKSSAVLAHKRRVAVLDAYNEIQIGRDPSPSEHIPRIRLKDMEVSKLHATLFWDRERKEWAVVDMGSKHGTFVKPWCSTSTTRAHCKQNDPLRDESNNTVTVPDLAFARLSPPRQASTPRALHHSDELSVGSTDFIVHVHPTGLPCNECLSEGELDIPLFYVPSRKITISQTQKKKSVGIAEENNTTRAPRDAKSAMTLLKKTLLSRHSDTALPTTLDGTSQRYIDRSARRRALHPYSRSNSPPPGVVSRSSPSMTNIPPRPATAISSGSSFAYGSSSSPPVSAPPAPISDANVGHRLLEKQGWVPGTTLGVLLPRYVPAPSDKEGEGSSVDTRMALSEPLHVSANIGRRGLGMRFAPSRRMNGA